MRVESDRVDGMRPERLGPKYALRLSDLREWHRLEARCFRNDCGHVELLDVIRLRRRFGEHTTLAHVEDRLRCSKCGNGLYNDLRVMRLPRS